MALSPQWLDELRSRVTLSSVIQRTTKLQRAGREWKACCPFHNENSPSFTVNDEKAFYHCFGCGAHGDVIRWMTDQRGLSFIDAVKELAEEAGMEVPRADPRAAERAEQRSSLHDVMQAAQEWFSRNLFAPEGKAARDYLATRGFDPHTAERFGFGYAPPGRTALKSALEKFEEPMLIESGLRIAVEGRDPYDRFRERLMLPIQDTRGKIIGFGGRLLDSTRKDAPKYLNSPDTPLFDKGRTLYNLHRAAPPARQSGRMLVVEGYMDVIALAAHGIEEAVAPMGTALTERQIELLWRVVDRPILCFDGDAAGQRAAFRAVTRALPLLQPGHSFAILRMPLGMDPDDLLKRDGRAAMESLLANPQSLLETLWLHEKEASPLNSPEDKAGLKARLMEHVETIQHPDIRSLYRRELMDLYSAFAFPKREFNNSRPPQKPRSNGRQPWGKDRIPELSPENATRLRRAIEGGARDDLTKAVFSGLTRHPQEIIRHAEALSRLASAEPALAKSIDHLFELSEILEEQGPDTISLGKTVAAPPDKTRFSFLMEGSDPLTVRDDLAEAVSLLVERPALEAAIARATARFDSDPEGSWAEQQRLRKRKLEIESRLGHMARKRAAAPATTESTQSASPEASGEHRMD